MQPNDITLRPEQDVYVRDKIWYVWVCDQTNMIVHSVGSPFPLTNMSIQNNTGLTIHEIGKINQPTWEILKKCSSSTYYIGFLDVDNEDIAYFKLKAYPVGGTQVNNKVYYNYDNIISMQVKLIDEHGDVADNIGKLEVKKITGRGNRELGDYEFIDHDTRGRKITIDNNDTVSVKINSIGQYSMKISGDFVINNITAANLRRFVTIAHNEYTV